MLSPRDGLIWYIGTMGFSYDDWRSVFYPVEMPARNFLGYYSRIFNAVEIDSTFYGTPRSATMKRWATSAPVGFKFCLKTPRSITHDAGLINVQEEMQLFLERVSLLGEALAVILLQFPPSFRADKLPDLERFLSRLPSGIRFAVEIRDSSWMIVPAGTNEPALAQLLREYEVCWAATMYPDLPERLFPTTDWLYIRWIGQHGSYDVHDHVRVDRSENLGTWIEQIRDYSDRFSEVYGFLNNDYAGFAVGTADLLKSMLHLPRLDFTPPQQASMF